jgi:putative spermidine/putrescine transport system permease protein/spermidine/putrescine transport system permease protein
MRPRETIELVVFRLLYGVILIALIAPLLIVIGTSFNQEATLMFPPEQFSLTWYREFLSDSQWLRAFANSLIIASATTVLSLILGTTAAYGIHGVDSRITQILLPVVLLPLLIPPVVIGVVLVIYMGIINLYQTYISIVFAHTLWAAPLVFFIMQAVLSRFDWQLRDAALDLGGTPVKAFRYAALPQIKSGIAAAGLIAFIISLQEFIMALFLSSYQTRTVPVLAWSSLRQFIDPIISVVSTILMLSILIVLVPIVALYSSDWIARQL